MNWMDFKPDTVTAAAVDAMRDDVLAGLGRADRKELPCKYFYDEPGSALFEEICTLEEYYPTRSELAIMQEHVSAMARAIGPRALLVELGAGSGLKTRILLRALDRPAAYVPIDISEAHLRQTAGALEDEFPELEVLPVAADYTRSLEIPAPSSAVARTVVYFPGSTVGNLHHGEAEAFLGRIREWCGPDGGLLIGVDRKKDRTVLERAYDDSRGVTAAFNLNLLRRLNAELGADFDLERFRHRAVYNETAGRIEMHLVSEKAQEVRIAGTTIAFDRGETVLTECSYKYHPEEFTALAGRAGFSPGPVWTDARRWFCVFYLRVR